LDPQVDLAQWQALGPLVSSQALDDGVVKLEISMPRDLWKQEDLVANLVLVLDVGAARTEAGQLYVPFHLDLRNRLDPDPLKALQRIRIHDVDPPYEIRFQPK
jgi:hypothetical protein